MRAIRVSATGGPDALQLEDIPTPDPGPGQIRIKVEAAGVNFVEIYQRKGQYKLPLPFTPGGEAAGTVDAVGPDVTDIHVGERAASVDARGSYAQYALVEADNIVPIPAGVSVKVAAAVMTQGITAHFLAHSVFRLEAGHGASAWRRAAWDNSSSRREETRRTCDRDDGQRREGADRSRPGRRRGHPL
jgi:NADPH2:quinone reductase